mmetsp:Transcript_36501/g.37893  ORF Transcript_36501/g.37893 Transcript_36501/m.37893 type:complete len:654 (-) Transcript_36501:61-2022(-)
MESNQQAVCSLFNLPSNEKIYDDFGCAYKDIMVYHGRLFLTENYICFNSNLLGFTQKFKLKTREVLEINKKKSLMISMIEIISSEKLFKNSNGKYYFTSFSNPEIPYSRLKKLKKHHDIKLGRIKSIGLSSSDESESESCVTSMNKGKLEMGRELSSKPMQCSFFKNMRVSESLNKTKSSHPLKTNEKMLGNISYFAENDIEENSLLTGKLLSNNKNSNKEYVSLNNLNEYFATLDQEKIVEIPKFIVDLPIEDFFEQFFHSNGENNYFKYYKDQSRYDFHEMNWKIVDQSNADSDLVKAVGEYKKKGWENIENAFRDNLCSSSERSNSQEQRDVKKDNSIENSSQSKFSSKESPKEKTRQPIPNDQQDSSSKHLKKNSDYTANQSLESLTKKSPTKSESNSKKYRELPLTEISPSKALIREIGFTLKVKNVPFVDYSKAWKTQKIVRNKSGFIYTGVTESSGPPYSNYFTFDETFEVYPILDINKEDKTIVRISSFINFNRQSMLRSMIESRCKEEYILDINSWKDWIVSRGVNVIAFNTFKSKNQQQSSLTHGLAKDTFDPYEENYKNNLEREMNRQDSSWQGKIVKLLGSSKRVEKLLAWNVKADAWKLLNWVAERLSLKDVVILVLLIVVIYHSYLINVKLEKMTGADE